VSNTKLSFLIFCYILCALHTYGQLPLCENSFNSRGQRDGKWLFLYDQDWKEVNDTSSYEFFRIIKYVSGVVHPPITDYYKTGLKQMEVWPDTSNLGSENTGRFIYYHPNGFKQMEGYQMTGVEIGEWIYYNENGDTSIIKDYKMSFVDSTRWEYWVRMGSEYSRIYNYNSAIYYYEKSIRLAKQLGEEHPDYAASLDYLAHFYEDIGQYEEALSLYNKSLNLRKKVFGEASSDYATSLNNLASLYNKTGRYIEAQPLFVKAVRIREKTLGEEHPDYATSVSDLALLLYSTGKYSEAEELFLKAVKILKKSLSEWHVSYINCLNNLASLYQQTSRYTEAEPLYLKAISICKSSLKEQSPFHATLLNNLASFYQDTDRYAEAELSYQKAMNIRKKILGEDHLDYATSLNNLALLYLSLGRYIEAEPLYKQAMNIYKRKEGEEYPEYANLLNNLADLYCKMGDYEEAEPLFLQSLIIKRKTTGEEHPDYASTLNNLAHLYAKIDQKAQAENLYLLAMDIRKKKLGEDHPDYATSLNDLAGLYADAGRYKEAEILYVNAINIRTKLMYEKPSDYVGSLNNLALFYYQIGRYAEADSLYSQALKITQKNIIKIFSFFSEKEQEQFLQTLFSDFMVYKSFGIIRSVVSDLAYETVLFEKGLLLENSRRMGEIIWATGDTSLINIYNQFLVTKKFIADQYSKSIDKRASNLEDFEKKGNELEKKLVTKASQLKRPGCDDYGTAIQLNWKDVQRNINPREAAIEFSDFEFVNNRWTDSIFYCAYIIKQGDSSPQQVFLFEQRQLDSLLQKIDYSTCGMDKECVANKINSFHDWDGNGKKLYELVWSKIEPYLKGVNTVYLSPSGKLHKINFSAIPTSQQSVLSDRYRLVQLNSTRSIALPSFKPVFVNDTNSLALFGGIQYDTDTTALKNAVAAYHEVKDADKPWLYASRGFFTDTAHRGMRWQYLPGTKKEVEGIMPLYPRAKQFIGLNATEEAVKTLQGKQKADVLHLATHGFFFKEEYTKDKEGKINAFRSSNDPLIRSGLMLAGGNLKWNGVELPGYMEDGILTAKEVAAMNLYGTKLVVLSACETGLGDIKGSEGVYGLQRAFKAAGAQYLLMSLWTVPDMATAEFMKRFYGTLKEGKDIETAFIQTQQHMRQQYNDPFYWAGFVLVR